MQTYTHAAGLANLRARPLVSQVAGLQFAGIEKDRFLGLHGIFTIDTEEPVANGRPHYSTAEGGHLYRGTCDTKWILNGIFSPDKPASCIEIVSPGAVPVGEAVWQYYDGSKYVDRTLTVSEVSTEEVDAATVALAESVAEIDAQATRVWIVPITLIAPNVLLVVYCHPAAFQRACSCFHFLQSFFVSVGLAWQAAGLQFAGIEKDRFPKLHGIFTIDTEEPVANGRPHYSTAEGGHLYYETDLGKWIVNGIFAPDKPNSCIEIIRPGAVPVGEAVWQYYDGSKYVDRTLTVSEVSTEEVGRAA
eukprot:SAG31_NODE_5321_length_2612_cov_2.787505_3_plen_304_part_00